MAGYWNKPDEAAAAMLDGGWYRTGDLGHVDEDGYLYLVDRAKDMIVTGGENVYCTEVEDVLYTHPAVLEATVFGIPDGRWGEAVHAVVVPRSDADGITAQALIEHCRGRIAELQDPQEHQLPGRPAAEVRAGQGAQADAAGVVLGRPQPSRSTENVRDMLEGTAMRRTAPPWRASAASECVWSPVMVTTVTATDFHARADRPDWRTRWGGSRRRTAVVRSKMPPHWRARSRPPPSGRGTIRTSMSATRTGCMWH